MSNLINATRTENSFTFNGAVTNSTSLDYCLDMFFLAGASRKMTQGDILTVFCKALYEDTALALKILFWARDVRGGAGERRFFRYCMEYLSKMHPDIFDQLVIFVPEYGYWKDVFAIDKPNNDSLDWIMRGLTERNDGLLAKWFPRKGPWFTAMHKFMKITPKELRKLLVSMTNVVETPMCANKWSEINYSHVPSVAMNRYRNAFFKRDGERMAKFITDVHNGSAKINASALYPHELYVAMMNEDNESAIEAQWNALPDYMAGSTERILPVCDVSGSMQGTPMNVSVGLGLYISERNRGIFKDAFITFSESPEMQYLHGTLSQRMKQLQSADWGMNTNLNAVFDLVLTSAVREKLPESEMPTKLLIISDMEFDEADRGRTNFHMIRKKYAHYGYAVPQIVFWNVNGRMGNSPAQVQDKGVGLVSGFSPAILKSILKGEIYSPKQLMLDTVMTDRYKRIRID
jgi:hypothetical protein